jgi:hypothetical protein
MVHIHLEQAVIFVYTLYQNSIISLTFCHNRIKQDLDNVNIPHKIISDVV